MTFCSRSSIVLSKVGARQYGANHNSEQPEQPAAVVPSACKRSGGRGRDFTPRENRVNPQGKPTTTRFSGIVRVVIGVSDLEGAVVQYRRAFSLPEPRRDRDDEFDAELAWFEGTPVVLARGLTPDSWLAHRVDQFGDAPCAFVLGASSGPMDARRSEWFGHTIVWTNETRLGWRLGMETAR